LSAAEIAAIDARAAANHPVVDALLAQYRVLERLYGAQADLLWTKSGSMTIHTPYTTAHQLCGEELFVTMLTDPAAAQAIFAKVWEIYQAIFARITAVTGARFNRIHLGDCSASLLSAETYREVVLPVNRQLARQFAHASYHSCGRSSHLLVDFATLPGLDAIQLGPGTDLAASARLMPGRHLQPLIDPLLMRDGKPDRVAAAISGILRDTASAPNVTLCAWSFDRDTPVENVAAMYEVVHLNPLS
jgi:uroporphyrinogen-III decarboxylase